MCQIQLTAPLYHKYPGISLNELPDRVMPSRPYFLIFALICLCVFHATYSHTADQPNFKLSFGVVPQQSATKLARHWTPILNYLGEKTGYRIDFMTAKDIPTFEKRCATGEYDIAYMNPYHYTVFHESPGYRAFAREDISALKGIIVVRNDSPYNNIDDLDGRKVAFPAPAAFAASVLTRGHLRKAGIDFNSEYVSSHDSVYLAVARGLYAAGGGIPRTFKHFHPEIRDQLRILWTSKGYTPHAIAAHPRVSEEIVQKILFAMTGMNKDAIGKTLLRHMEVNGLIPAEDSEWNDVRHLEINILEEMLRQ